MDLQFKMAHKEMEHYMKNWAVNPHKTDAQKKMYPFRRIRKDMLGDCRIDENTDCIRLLEEDGWDGRYIGSVAPQTAKEYSWKRDYQVHPNVRDLLRFGIFFHLGFYKTLILIIKSDCEKYLYERIVRDGLDDGVNSITLITNMNIDNKYLVDYAFDIKKRMNFTDLFNLFQEHNNFVRKNGYDESTFKFLIMDIAVNKVQVYPLNSEFTEKFISEREKESMVIANIDFALKEQYHKLRQRWTELKNSIEQLLVQQDEIRERNCIIRSNWSKIFGKLKIELNELMALEEKLDNLINLKESNTDKSYDEIMQLVKEVIKEKKEKIEEEKKRIEILMSSAKILDQKDIIQHMSTSGASLEDKIQLKNKLKAMKKSLYFQVFKLTHPDVTDRESFTPEQRDELLHMYENISHLKELHTLDTMENIALLESVLTKAERIWGNIGINVDDFDMEILEGESEEIIEKLKVKLEYLEDEETEIHNETFVLLNDSEINAMEIVLANEETSNREVARYKEKICELKEKVRTMKKIVTELFDKETAEKACA